LGLILELEPGLSPLVLREVPPLHPLLVRGVHPVEDQGPGKNDGTGGGQLLMPCIGDGLVDELQRIGVREVSLDVVGFQAVIEIGEGPIRVQDGQRNGANQTPERQDELGNRGIVLRGGQIRCSIAAATHSPEEGRQRSGSRP